MMAGGGGTWYESPPAFRGGIAANDPAVVDLPRQLEAAGFFHAGSSRPSGNIQICENCLLFTKRRTPFVTRRPGYQWGSPIDPVLRCLFFIPTQKSKQFRGIYRFIVQQLLSLQWTLQNLDYGITGQRKRKIAQVFPVWYHGDQNQRFQKIRQRH